jgi:hypothetical protein
MYGMRMVLGISGDGEFYALLLVTVSIRRRRLGVKIFEQMMYD